MSQPLIRYGSAEGSTHLSEEISGSDAQGDLGFDLGDGYQGVTWHGRRAAGDGR